MARGTQRFGAKWSLAVCAITSIVILAVIAVVALTLRFATQPGPAGEPTRPWLGLLAFLPAAILSVTILFAPLGFTVGKIGIIINRMGPRIWIRHEDIADFQRIDAHAIGFRIRLFGSGGFFGFFGWFYGRRLGRFRGYITNHKDLVLITLRDGGKLVLSPHPAEAFLEYLEKNRAQTSG